MMTVSYFLVVAVPTVLIKLYFVLSSEFNAYLKQSSDIAYNEKKYRIFSLVTNTINIFSL